MYHETEMNGQYFVFIMYFVARDVS